MKQDIFRIDGGTGYKGFHEPAVHWNGWRVPYFNYETCQEISNWVLTETASDGLDSVRFYAVDGEVFHEHEGERNYCENFIINGEMHYRVDGWIWECDDDQ